MIITKFKHLFYLLIISIVLLFSLPCFASETNLKVFGKLETASIIQNNDSIEIMKPENFSFKLPEYAEYYVQERDERMDTPIVHIFGVSTGSVADFEIIVNSFDLENANSTLLDQIGVNFYVFGEEANVISSEELQVGDLYGFNLILSNMRFNGAEIFGNINLVILLNETKCICLLMIGRQNNQEIYNQILTEIASTIKI